VVKKASKIKTKNTKKMSGKRVLSLSNRKPEEPKKVSSKKRKPHLKHEYSRRPEAEPEVRHVVRALREGEISAWTWSFP